MTSKSTGTKLHNSIESEAKIASIFEGIGLDGAKMESFDNPGPLEAWTLSTPRAFDIS